MGPKLICICSEAVGNPYLWVVSNFFALLQKQSLAFHVCPATQPTHDFAHSTLREYSAPFCRSCFSLQARLLVHTLLPALTTLLGGFQQQSPASVLLLPFLLQLYFSTSCFLFPPHSSIQYNRLSHFPRGWVMGSKLLFCVSELMNTPAGRSGE